MSHARNAAGSPDIKTSLEQAFIALRRGVPGPLKPPVDSMNGLWSEGEKAPPR